MYDFAAIILFKKGGFMAVKDIVGQRVRLARLARGMTQMQLAKETHLPQSLISQIESGAREGSGITLKAARQLAFALHLSLDALAGIPGEDVDGEFLPTAPALASTTA